MADWREPKMVTPDEKRNNLFLGKFSQSRSRWVAWIFEDTKVSPEEEK